MESWRNRAASGARSLRSCHFTWRRVVREGYISPGTAVKCDLPNPDSDARGPLCAQCRKPTTAPDLRPVPWLDLNEFSTAEWHVAGKCAACNNQGFQNTAITFEFLELGIEIGEQLLGDYSTASIYQFVLDGGVIPLRQWLVQLAREGQTTTEELGRLRLGPIGGSHEIEITV